MTMTIMHSNEGIIRYFFIMHLIDHQIWRRSGLKIVMDFIINVTHNSANTGNISGDSKIENFMEMCWDRRKKTSAGDGGSLNRGSRVSFTYPFLSRWCQFWVLTLLINYWFIWVRPFTVLSKLAELGGFEPPDISCQLSRQKIKSPKKPFPKTIYNYLKWKGFI